MFMKSTSKPLTKNNLERGQSLTELAISFPVILLLMLGTLDFGMATYSYLIIRDAAQEGALYGSINPNNNTEIENRARFIAPKDDLGGVYFSPVELPNKETVTVNIKTSGENCQGITNGKINSITVVVSYNYPILIPFSESIIGRNSIALDATATNVIIQPACK
jgi:Flp pilus assembly protein TadG